MNILTMCVRGDNRSVITASILRNEKGYKDVISCGAYTFSQQTLVMLYDWADKILICAPNIRNKVHPEYQEKVIEMSLGDDPYGPNFHPPFKELARELLKKNGL